VSEQREDQFENFFEPVLRFRLRGRLKKRTLELVMGDIAVIWEGDPRNRRGEGTFLGNFHWRVMRTSFSHSEMGKD